MKPRIYWSGPMPSDPNRLREHREHGRYTQQDLADAVGVGRVTINRIESGKQRPTVDLALKLGKKLGTSVETLFTEPKEPDPQLNDGPLPLPTDMGGPEVPFGEAVDAYVAVHRVSKAETFRRIAAETGNSPKGLSLRYGERGDRVWR